MDDNTALSELKKQLQDAEPQIAIDAYSKLFESRPKMEPNVAINLTNTIADL